MKLAAYELIKEFLENLLKRPANRGNYVSLHVYKKKVIVPDGSRGCKGFQFEYFRDHVRRTLYVEIFAENKGNPRFEFICDNGPHGSNFIHFPFMNQVVSDNIYLESFKKWFYYPKLHYDEQTFVNRINRPMQIVFNKLMGAKFKKNPPGVIPKPSLSSLSPDLVGRIQQYALYQPDPEGPRNYPRDREDGDGMYG